MPASEGSQAQPHPCQAMGSRECAHSVVGAGVRLHPSAPHGVEARPGLLPAAAGHGLVVRHLRACSLSALWTDAALSSCARRLPWAGFVASRLMQAPVPHLGDQPVPQRWLRRAFPDVLCTALKGAWGAGAEGAHHIRLQAFALHGAEDAHGALWLPALVAHRHQRRVQHHVAFQPCTPPHLSPLLTPDAWGTFRNCQVGRCWTLQQP